MKNILILLALIGSFVLAGCPKDDSVVPAAPTDDAAASVGADQTETVEPK